MVFKSPAAAIIVHSLSSASFRHSVTSVTLIPLHLFHSLSFRSPTSAGCSVPPTASFLFPPKVKKPRQNPCAHRPPPNHPLNTNSKDDFLINVESILKILIKPYTKVSCHRSCKATPSGFCKKNLHTHNHHFEMKFTLG